MKKKAYIAPTMVIIIAKTSRLICASLGVSNTNVTSDDQVYSRGGSIWDDEE